MQHRAGLLVALFALGVVTPAQAVSETAEGFSAAMQGCWNRTNWAADSAAPDAEAGNSVSSQMCLGGGTAGLVTVVDCHTHGDLTECSSQEGRYEFRDEKFWRDFDGVRDSCDVSLKPGKEVALTNCLRIDPPPAVEPIEDAVYERAIGQ